ALDRRGSTAGNTANAKQKHNHASGCAFLHLTALVRERASNMSDAGAQILQGLAALGGEFTRQFAAAENEQALRSAKAALLGKSGELTKILKLMPAVAPEQRREVGERVNAVRNAVEAAFEERLTALAATERDKELNAAPHDLTLPG